MFSQADEVGCTLLLQVNNELKDVAKARIVAPLNRVFHTVPMADTMFRVTLDRVFRVAQIWILRLNPQKPIAS